MDVLERSWAEWIEAKSFLCVYNGKFTSHGQHSTFAGRICQLGRCTSSQGDNTCRVNDTSLGLFMFTQAEHGMFAPKPNPFDVDRLCEIPDLLGGIDSISIVRMHDSGIIEHDVDTTPRVETVNHCGNFWFFGDIAFVRLDAGMVGEDFNYLSKCSGKSRFGDVCHEDFCPFARKENGSLKANATNQMEIFLSVMKGRGRWNGYDHTSKMN